MACYLWLLMIAVLVSPMLAMHHEGYRKTNGWRDHGHGWLHGGQDRTSGLQGRLDKIELLVEEAVKAKKKKSHHGKKKQTSSSSSSNLSPECKKTKKQKREKKQKSVARQSDGSSGALSTEEKKELLEFRRQAEMDKMRAEIQASMMAEKLGKRQRPSPKAPRTAAAGTADPRTPKTCRIIAAESKIFQEHGVKQLLGDVSIWQQVSDQLSALPVPEPEALLKQFFPKDSQPS